MGSRMGLAAAVLSIGAVVGSLVALASTGAGIELCGADLDGQCAAIARSFALRTGLLVGGVTVLMQLTVAGLLRMVAIEERRRFEVEAPLPRGGAALGVRRG